MEKLLVKWDQCPITTARSKARTVCIARGMYFTCAVAPCLRQAIKYFSEFNDIVVTSENFVMLMKLIDLPWSN